MLRTGLKQKVIVCMVLRDYAICQMEDLVNTLYLYCNIININTYADIQNKSVDENYAQAYCYVGYMVTACSYYNVNDKCTTYFCKKLIITESCIKE